MTEREQLVDLLSYFVGPTMARTYWHQTRSEWGFLSADELWNLGCHETVRRWLFDSAEAHIAGIATVSS